MRINYRLLAISPPLLIVACQNITAEKKQPVHQDTLVAEKIIVQAREIKKVSNIDVPYFKDAETAHWANEYASFLQSWKQAIADNNKDKMFEMSARYSAFVERSRQVSERLGNNETELKKYTVFIKTIEPQLKVLSEKKL